MRKWTVSVRLGAMILMSLSGVAQASTWLDKQIIVGQQALAAGNYTGAIQAFYTALQVSTQNSLAQTGLKEALRMEAESDPSREQSSITSLSYEGALPILDPNLFSEAEYLNLGNISDKVMQQKALLILAQLQVGDYQAALKASQTLLKQKPSPSAYNLMGLAQMHRGDSRQAKQAFESALHGDPTFHMARLNLAEVLMTGGDFQAAEQQVEKVLKATQMRHKVALKSMILLKQRQGDELGAQGWSLRLRES